METQQTKVQKPRLWFADARLGMFIHWGIHSVMGDAKERALAGQAAPHLFLPAAAMDPIDTIVALELDGVLHPK